MHELNSNKVAGVGHRVLIVWFLAAAWLWLPEAAAGEPGPPKAKMAHIFIHADANEVMFENIWVFERTKAGEPWNVVIDLPEGASRVEVDEPGSTVYSDASWTVTKAITGDSLIDSVGFSYVLGNDDGVCVMQVVPRYGIDLLVASVSGPGTRLSSNFLKLDEDRQSRSKYSGVYTAEGLAAQSKVAIELSRLPRADTGLFEKICGVAFGVIIAAALVTAFALRRSKNTRSGSAMQQS